MSAGIFPGLSHTTRYLIIEAMTPTRPSSSKISRLLFGVLALCALVATTAGWLVRQHVTAACRQGVEAHDQVDNDLAGMQQSRH